MSVRTATPADLDPICALADEIAALHHGNAPNIFAAPDAQRDRGFWLSSITQSDATLIVATRDAAIVGFITGRVATANAATFLEARAICRVGTVVVASRAQRQGIGTELIRAIESWGQERSAVETRLEVFAFNHQAASFYAHLGYRVQSHVLQRDLP